MSSLDGRPITAVLRPLREFFGIFILDLVGQPIYVSSFPKIDCFDPSLVSQKVK